MNTLGQDSSEQAYDAFISYSSKDISTARRVQRFLQRRHVPNSGQPMKVFLDRTDIRGGELGLELEAALTRSKWLVVCCSPSAAESKWVDREIASFLQSHKALTIVLLLIAGNANISVPKLAMSYDLRIHDIRRGWLFGMAVKSTRDELLRAIALVTAQDLRSLINWDRRRLSVQALASFLSLGGGAAVVQQYIQRQKKVQLSQLSATLQLSLMGDEGEGSGGMLNKLFVDRATLKIAGMPADGRESIMTKKWPWNVEGFHATNPSLLAASIRQTIDLRQESSTAGLWITSVRTFTQFQGRLSEPIELATAWQNARFEARLEVVGFAPTSYKGGRPEAENRTRFRDLYGITEVEESEPQNADYSVTALPIVARFQLFLGGELVARSVGIAARVKQGDEDARGMNYIYFPSYGAREDLPSV